MREGKDFGSDRMVSFDVILTQKAGSDRTVKEVFFIVELSSKPKSFGVSPRMKETQLWDNFIYLKSRRYVQ